MGSRAYRNPRVVSNNTHWSQTDFGYLDDVAINYRPQETTDFAKSQMARFKSDIEKYNADSNWKGFLYKGQHYTKQDVGKLKGADLDDLIVNSSYNVDRARSEGTVTAGGGPRSINDGKRKVHKVFDTGYTDFANVFGFTKQQYDEAKKRQEIRALFGKEVIPEGSDVSGGGANTNQPTAPSQPTTPSAPSLKPISQTVSPFLQNGGRASNNSVGGGRTDNDLTPLGILAELGGRRRTLF